MHILSFRSFLLFWGFCFALLQALTIPDHHRSNLALRDVKLSDSVDFLDLDRREAAKAKPKPKPKPKPSTKSPPPPATSKATPPPPPPSSSAAPPPPPPSSKIADPLTSSNPPKSSSARPTSIVISSTTSGVSTSALASVSKVSSSVSGSSVSSIASSSFISSTASGSSVLASSSSFSVLSTSSGLPSSSISASTSTSSGSSSISTSTYSGSSTSSSISSSSSVFEHVVRPTAAINTCLLPGVDCFEDFEEFDGVSDETEDVPATNSTQRLAKRGDREFKADIVVGTLDFESLGYPGPSKLFKDTKGKKLTPHAYNFKSADLDDFSVKDFGDPAVTTGYVTEHIIELQTIKMFIESAVGAPKGTKLSKTVPGKFFQDWWNKPLDAAEVKSRAQPPIEQAPFKKDEERTLNNLVFQALGSSYNRAEFVLCGSEINGYKERVWSGSSPMDDIKFKKYASDVATGGAKSNVHMSALRTTLAVYKYFDDATIKGRLKKAVANVKIELSNIKYLTGEDVDLAGLWSEFMVTRLEEVETNGKTWLAKSIKVAETAYNTEMQKFKKLEADLKAEKNLPAAQKQKLDKERNQKEKDLKDEKKTLDTKQQSASKAVKDAENAVEALITQIAAANNKSTADSLKKQRDAEKRTLEKAEGVLYEATKAANLKAREIHELNLQNVQEIIVNIKKDQDLLATYKTASANINMPNSV